MKANGDFELQCLGELFIYTMTKKTKEGENNVYYS